MAWPFASPPPPTPPPAQTDGANITVTTCHAQLDPPPLRIAYTNTGPKTAVEVHFHIVSNAGSIEDVVDHGQFASQQPINHVFKLPDNASPLGLSSVRCVVTKIIYEDGSSWTNPSAGP